MTAPPDEPQGSVQAWLEYAEADLDVARRSLQPPARLGLACNLAQQAAEKALKAYLVSLGVPRVPRTHDLELLAERIVEAGGEAPEAEAAAVLTDYAVEARYPESPAPAPEEADYALVLAERVVSFVRGRV
jgi:HEPN domain-containing protein